MKYKLHVLLSKLKFITVVNRIVDFKFFYNNYDAVVQFILRLAEFEKYAVVVNLCILESFKLLEKCFKLLVFAA